MVWAYIKSCQIQQGALGGARITDGIGQCMEMVQQDEVLKTHPRVTSIPGPTSSATNVSMVVSAGPWSSEKAEMNNLEINKKSHPQLVENKQEFRNLQQKFLVTQVAYFLANG
ncbi:neuroblastoma breakpoint family member 3-like, partial [Hylobates moloch]|uniref:neuroblastoma breakpoint family member 3-like n=1 Tax=Hylobates moloch TaxID=81572 RepID=UPI001361F595